MSVSEFGKTLRGRIAITLKNKISRRSTSLKGFIGADTEMVDRLRNRFKSAKYNNIIITQEGFKNILNKLSSYGTMEFSEYRDYMVYRRNNPKPISIDIINSNTNINGTKSNSASVSDPWTIIYNTPYDNLKTWTSEYFILKGIPAKIVSEVLGGFESGHTAGLLTFRSLVSFGSTVDLTTNGIVIRGEPDLAYFDRINQLLLDIDLAATNSIGTNTGIYTTAIKDLKKGAQFYIEFQAKTNDAGTGNQDTGKLVANLSKTLAKFSKASAAGSSDISKEFRSIGEEIVKQEKSFKSLLSHLPEDIRKTALENIDILVNTRGSKSIVEHIEDTIVSNIKTGKSSIGGITVYPEIKLQDIQNPLEGIDTKLKGITKELSNVISKVKSTVAKSNPRKMPKLRNRQTGKFSSLLSIQNLINIALKDQIRKNMGTGSRKDILNYRSGRFAESAKVERVSTSREGMITAFYSYMKYPYQTFEPGFRQGSPTSRDPKLLISKSIREIAATLVGNKLRAVRL